MTQTLSHDTLNQSELLARFIVSSKSFRSDGTLRADAFIPDRRAELSVTRHGDLANSEIWAIGISIAQQRVRQLYGRGDAAVSVYQEQELSVRPDPVPENPNHANVLGWPQTKNAQIQVALEIAKAALFVPAPPNQR